MKLVEVQELVEPANAALGDLARMVDVEAINGRIEASLSPAGEAVEILDAEDFKR
jgi:hypothetical protein